MEAGVPRSSLAPGEFSHRTTRNGWRIGYCHRVAGGGGRPGYLLVGTTARPRRSVTMVDTMPGACPPFVVPAEGYDRLMGRYRGASDQMHQFGVVIPNHWRPVISDPFVARGWWQGVVVGRRPARLGVRL